MFFETRIARLLFLCLLLMTGVANAQWERVDVSTTASLRGLSVVSADIVWASGTGGTVIRTGDGGKHWSVITVPGAEKLDFRGIHALDGTTAIIISSGPAEKGQARIYRTNDGGANWKQVFEETHTGIFFDAIAFWDRRHGIVLSDPTDGKFALFTTDDAGVTWKQVPPAALPAALPDEGAFAASNSCLAVQGSGNAWFATGGARVARVFRSSDRGQHWSVAETPMHPANASSGIFSLTFQNAKNGIAVGGDYAHPEGSDLPNLLMTSDGGESWHAGAATSPPGMYLSGVSSQDSHSLVAVGIGGLVVKSSRGWNQEAEENLNTVIVGFGGAWAVGAKGVVLRQSSR